MIVSMDKKYTLDGEVFTVLTVTKPGRYPVAGYNEHGELYSFTSEGLGHYRNTPLIEVSPYADFVIDERVMVRDFDTSQWRRAHFAGIEKNGRATAWTFCSTKWASTTDSAVWKQCRRPTAEELAT